MIIIICKTHTQTQRVLYLGTPPNLKKKGKKKRIKSLSVFAKVVSSVMRCCGQTWKRGRKEGGGEEIGSSFLLWTRSSTTRLKKKKDANTQKRRERENRRLLQSSAARNTEHDSRGEKKEKSF
jgi:hypothetical protein